MNVKGILTLMGFAQKAGKLAAGDAAVDNFLQKGKVALLILSEEVSENKKRDWQLKADLAETAMVTLNASKLEMGLAVGMSPRGIIGIMDKNMAEAIMKKLQQ